MEKGFWSAGRLVIGIVLLVLSVLVLFQSCAAGVVNTLESSDDAGGSAGFIVSIFMIVAGIIGICTRNSGGKAGPVTAAVFLFLGALPAFFNSAVFQDLVVWGVLCAALGIVFVICGIKTVKSPKPSDPESPGQP